MATPSLGPPHTRLETGNNNDWREEDTGLWDRQEVVRKVNKGSHASLLRGTPAKARDESPLRPLGLMTLRQAPQPPGDLQGLNQRGSD